MRASCRCMKRIRDLRLRNTNRFKSTTMLNFMLHNCELGLRTGSWSSGSSGKLFKLRSGIGSARRRTNFFRINGNSWEWRKQRGRTFKLVLGDVHQLLRWVPLYYQSKKMRWPCVFDNRSWVSCKKFLIAVSMKHILELAVCSDATIRIK